RPCGEHRADKCAGDRGQERQRHSRALTDLVDDRDQQLLELIQNQLHRALLDSRFIHFGRPSDDRWIRHLHTPESSIAQPRAQRATTCNRTLPSVSTSFAASGISPFTGVSLTCVPLVLPRSVTTQ